jgi:hypothetical protein
VNNEVGKAVEGNGIALMQDTILAFTWIKENPSETG